MLVRYSLELFSFVVFVKTITRLCNLFYKKVYKIDFV